MQLNDLGARLVVDGVFGPQTDAAVKVCDLLCRRDRLSWPFGTAPAHSTRSADSLTGMAMTLAGAASP